MSIYEDILNNFSSPFLEILENMLLFIAIDQHHVDNVRNNVGLFFEIYYD